MSPLPFKWTTPLGSQMYSFLMSSAREEQTAEDSEIYVTTTVRDMLIGSSRSFQEEGSYQLKGIRIRVGIHAGEPIEEEADLHGTSVIRASRIMDTAQGDQILISSVVKELVAGRDYDLTSQGMHPLKGITEPIQLFAVEWRPKAE